MRCSRCRHENRFGAKFCDECGAHLVSLCARPTAKFCSDCGSPAAPLGPATPSQQVGAPKAYTPRHLTEKILTSKAALEGERKQVTILFADLIGSMELFI